MQLRSIIIVILSLIILSCAEEDPNLVNAPPQTESIRVRFLNFYSDVESNTPQFKLVLDGKTETELTPNQMISHTIKPPADSSIISIKDETNNEIFKASRKIRFSRGNFYSVIYSKAYFTDTTGTKLVDTTVFVTSLANIPKKRDYSYIRLFNAVFDTNATYSLRLGCPGGQLIGNANYLRSTPQSLVYADKNQPVSISITKTKNNITENIGLFELKLEELKQYMLVIYKDDPNQNEKVYLFDEFDEGVDSFIELQPNTGDLISELRMINFTNDNIDFFKKTDSTITSLGDVAPFTISRTIQIPTCLGNTKDTIFYQFKNDTIRTTTSLEVNQKYTVFSFNTSDSTKSILLAEPYRIKTNGKASVRVLNVAYGKPNLTLSIAARTDNEASLGYSSGKIIAENSNPGTLSEPVLIEPGENIPVTVFSAGEAAQLQYTTILDLKGDEKYIITVYSENATSDYQIFTISEFDENQVLTTNDKGVFTQYVNLIPGYDYINATISNMASNIKMYYSSSVATVLLPGTHNFNINDKDTTFEVESNKNLLFIFAGDETQTDFFVYQYTPLAVKYNSYKRRFVNASKEIQLLNVKENKDDDNTTPIIEGLRYGEMSKTDEKELNKNLSFFFKNFQTGETVYRVDDLPFPFGKNYTIVFGGRSSDNSYSVVVVQEY